MRRIASILACALFASATSAETHLVLAYDMTFEPEVVQVNVGDTILWRYVSGTPHTVTSGDPCTWDGLFYGGLSVALPVFEWVVPEDAASVIPYFCAPHCVNGMVGTIEVAQECMGDLNDDGVVDGNDILFVLAYWGVTGSSGDATGNGVVDGDDLLVVLENWGSCG